MPRLILPMFAILLSGCASFQNRPGASAPIPTVGNTANPADDERKIDKEDELIMLSARKGMSKAQEPDKMWYDHVMSEKARSIERSLGVEYH